MKKKINPKDLYVSPDVANNSQSSKGGAKDAGEKEVQPANEGDTFPFTIDCFNTLENEYTCNKECKTNLEGFTCKCDGEGDGKSQQDGTGSLCISVVLCMPTEKNCELSQKVCQELTRQAGCKETIDYCISTACIYPSENYCLVTEKNCKKETLEETCVIPTGEECPETEWLCPPINSIKICPNTDEC